MRFVILMAFACVTSAAASDQTQVDYDRDIRPILSENCFLCHGQDSKKRMAGLRLDSFAGATADRGGHAALAPSKTDASAMYQRITAEQPARRMPPTSSNRSLTADQIALIKRWIEQGGVYSKHWAFVPPTRPQIPVVTDRAWVKQPIDAFVYKRLASEGLRPSPAASPSTWLRRVSLDLIGLPPSLAEMESFAKDVEARGEAAYGAAVDRLLASPRYGERMALDWMDVSRYADTHGFNNDSSRSMWRWRDWVIQSFNRNMPYDRFITEQLAGDLLPNPTLDQRIATGFGRNHVINSEGGIIDEEYRVEYVTDRVNTMSAAWLGLTVGCAHCHDHKFDPITQRDHYRLFAFFNNVPEIGEDGRVANAVPMISAPTDEQQRRMRQLESAIAALSKKLEREPHAAAVAPIFVGTKPPMSPVLQISCEMDKDFTHADGVAGQACVADATAKPLIPGKGVPVSKRQPMTVSMWLRPTAADSDVPLLSTMDHATTAAAVISGKGIEFRLVGGELEFRWADRFPAYSIRIRSEGARIEAGAWRQVALVYEGPAAGAMRVLASQLRIFVDGQELPTHVLNDGLAMPDDDKPAMTRFRIGWDNDPHTSRYAGLFDQLTVWSRALTLDELRAHFENLAIPYATRQSHPSALESGWLRTAAIKSKELDQLRTEYLELRRNAPTVMVMEEMATPRESHILLRGGYNTLGDKVDAGVPEELLGAWPANAPKNRLGLAIWLTKPDHPLTSRVVVNRFWQQLFGQGIVKTSDNFGMQGEFPSHPELLDWLAREFIDSGWNVKALMKRMVLSSTYRQDSNASQELFARDPENRLLARGPRFRLPAEIIRDQALSISGLLKERLGGPGVFPYQTPDLYKGIVVAASYPGTRWVESQGDDLYRRSLYTFWKRTVPHPTMTVFDAPDREFCVVRRSATNTPLQALTLLNEPTFVESARKLAERSIHEGGATPDARVAFAFRLATGRAPDAEELRVLRQKLAEMLAAYRVDETAARKLVAVGASHSDTAIPASELAAYTAVANIILNLDEVITKG